MPFQLLDLILIGIMLVSGLLALMRGFTREVLTLVAWGGAAIATYYAIQQQALIDLVLPYIDKPLLAKVAVGAGVFIVVLILISLISVKISDAVVDSSVGAFDRTLGFLFGLGRGFILVVIAYLFYGWFETPEKQYPWVRNAMSLPLIQSAGHVLVSYMPADIADTLNNTALITNPEKPPTGTGPGKDPAYQSNDQQGLDNLIEGTGNGGGNAQPGSGNQQQPTFGQGNGQ